MEVSAQTLKLEVYTAEAIAWELFNGKSEQKLSHWMPLYELVRKKYMERIVTKEKYRRNPYIRYLFKESLHKIFALGILTKELYVRNPCIRGLI